MVKHNAKGVRIAAALLLVFLFQQICSKAGSFAADIFDYSSIDTHNVFAWISVHHTVQTLLALVPVAVLSKTYGINFGFHLGDKKTGVKYVKIFTAAMFAYYTVLSVITYFSNQTIQYDYPLTAANVLGYMGFQLFLSGPSEEILFRALPISIIARFIPSKQDFQEAKLPITWATVISAIFFALAHIQWTINPFSVRFDPMQLLFSLFLGILYGIVYQKTKSVIYPMIMHSLTNVTVVGAGYVLSMLK